MSVDVTQLVMDRYFINELTKELESKNKELAHRWKELQRKCNHPTIRTERDYIPGSYYDRSYVTIKEICKLCEAVVKNMKTQTITEVTDENSYY